MKGVINNYPLLFKMEERTMIVQNIISTNINKEKLVLLTEVKNEEQLQIGSIECILADNIFTKVFFNNKQIVQVRQSLNEWEKLLPQNFFIRVNRGVIINLAHVKLIEKSSNQTMIIYMQNYDKPVIMSRCYTSKLKGKLII